MPTIFVPYENPMMDEQLTRAQSAQRNGLGLCQRTREVCKVRPYVTRILDSGFRAEVRSRCAELPSSYGATEMTRLIEELVHTVREDREPRGFWA